MGESAGRTLAAFQRSIPLITLQLFVILFRTLIMSIKGVRFETNLINIFSRILFLIKLRNVLFLVTNVIFIYSDIDSH